MRVPFLFGLPMLPGAAKLFDPMKQPSRIGLTVEQSEGVFKHLCCAIGADDGRHKAAEFFPHRLRTERPRRIARNIRHGTLVAAR